VWYCAGLIASYSIIYWYADGLNGIAVHIDPPPHTIRAPYRGKKKNSVKNVICCNVCDLPTQNLTTKKLIFGFEQFLD
jgi:hypothetical protein